MLKKRLECVELKSILCYLEIANLGKFTYKKGGKSGFLDF